MNVYTNVDYKHRSIRLVTIFTSAHALAQVNV